MSGTEIIALVLALVGIIAGAYAAIRGDVQAAGGGVVLVGIAFLITLALK